MAKLIAATVVVGLAIAGVSPASAELVTLTTGRVFSVARVVENGDRTVLTLRGGGEITCPRTLVASIAPDEVPPEPEPPAPVADTAEASPAAPTPYGEMIDRLSGAHGVSPSLVRAVVQVESGFRADARSRKGAKGLMQLMPSTARMYQLTTPYEPEANLDAGIRHLRALLDRYDVPEALAAYNAGEGAVLKHRGVPPYRETRAYVRNVLALAVPGAR